MLERKSNKELVKEASRCAANTNVKLGLKSWHNLQIASLRRRKKFKQENIEFRGEKNKRMYFHLNKPVCAAKKIAIYARMIFTKSGCNKVLYFASLSSDRFPPTLFIFSIHTLYYLTEYLCIYNLRAEITIIFENNFLQFYFRSRNCARQPLAMHEFLMHFSQLFSLLHAWLRGAEKRKNRKIFNVLPFT